MSVFKQGFPNVAYYIENKNGTSARIAFKCRILEEEFQYYTQPAAGLADIGGKLTISTWKKLNYKPGAKVILNDIFYSVEAITPYIPDPIAGGFTKNKKSTEYLIQLM